MSVEVRFNTKPGKPDGRNLIAVAGPPVRAVFPITNAQGMAMAPQIKFKDNAARHRRAKVPPGVKLIDEATNQETTLAADEEGPPVCYWVGDELICW